MKYDVLVGLVFIGGVVALAGIRCSEAQSAQAEVAPAPAPRLSSVRISDSVYIITDEKTGNQWMWTKWGANAQVTLLPSTGPKMP